MSSSTSTSVPHEWPTSISCLIYVDKLFLLNDFNITVGFQPVIENPILNDIAIEKIEMFCKTLMNGAVILDKKDYSEEITKLVDNNFIMVPGKANDQTMGCLILSKLIAIVGDDLEISHVVISSELGNNIRFTFDIDSLELSVLLPTKEDWWEDKETKLLPWWERNDSATYDLKKDDGIYEGDFTWEDMFKDELAEAEQLNKTVKKFQIITGGKDAN